MVRKKLRKGSKAAKAWGRKMRALRMGKVAKKRIYVKAKRTKRRVNFMAKRRRASHRRSSLGSAGGLMAGLWKPKGLIASALLGVGASMAAQRVIGNVHPLQNTAIGFVVGGVPGAAANYLLTGMQGATNASSVGVLY